MIPRILESLRRRGDAVTYYAANRERARNLTAAAAREFWDETPDNQRAGNPDGDFEIWALSESGTRHATTRFTPVPNLADRR